MDGVPRKLPTSPESTLLQHEIPIRIPLVEISLQESQTLEPHQFRCHLQIILSPLDESPKESVGILLLLPLDFIVSILILHHEFRGQSLRFKLADAGQRKVGAIRRAIVAGNPGRVYGDDEDDPCRLLAMLKFREFVVKNTGVEERHMEIAYGWAAFLKSNAMEKYSHHIQVVKESLDAVLTIADEGEVLVEDYLLNGDREGSIRNSRNRYPEVRANHRRRYDSYRPGRARDVLRRTPLRIERRE
jgi:hypothetical protein